MKNMSHLKTKIKKRWSLKFGNSCFILSPQEEFTHGIVAGKTLKKWQSIKKFKAVIKADIITRFKGLSRIN